MRAALHRLVTPIFGWIPDVSTVPPRKQAAIGMAVSILLHLLILLLLFIFGSAVFPRVQSLTPEKKHDLEVEIVSQPTHEPFKKIDNRQLLRDLGFEPSPVKPKDARFESEHDSVAGSETPPTGLQPLPSQEGKDSPELAFKDQDIQLSTAKETPSGPTDPFAINSPSPTAPGASAPSPATTTPLYAPQPLAKEDLNKAEKAPPTEKLAEPAKPTHATPPPLQKVDKPAEDQMAVAKPSDQTTLKPITKVENAESTPPPHTATTPPPQYANLTTPRPLGMPSFTKSYKEQLKKTMVPGMISNTGRNGVDQIATPAGRWWSQVQGAIKQNWSLFVHEGGDMISTGIVKVSFSIASDGRVRNVRLDSSSGNRGLENACLRAIRETPIPAPPPDLVAPLNGESIEQTISFNLYPVE